MNVTFKDKERSKRRMDSFAKEEILRELSTVHSHSPKVIDRITYLIRGDFPKYIGTLKDELKDAHEKSVKLEARIKQLEKEALYNQILLRQFANDLDKQAQKMKSEANQIQMKAPLLNRLR